ncbi:hypothetical protein JMJ35_002007 [Cladonia borealis]|uniref:Uncharacterized protein n=1 Tax=Cladonia borealis TaxID=184061 RepID=A0AA39R6Y6_9LECA|nr:hypothetical protein JMJ35_002007 [Cladonia borealis]
MSLNAGGLAQMTYNPHNSFETGLGVPGSGFASRRGGPLNKRLSVAPPSSISTINESHPHDANPTPRTSRSHLLAGLRTAPKSPTFPSSAPPTQVQQPFRFDQSGQASKESYKYGRGMPQTAVGGSFPNNQRYAVNGNGQMYALPEILAPPALQFEDEHEDDPAVMAELMATNQYLAQQQMRLQQQLLSLTVAQQQMQNMNLDSGMGRQQQQYFQSPMAPMNGFYNQQLQSGMQPLVAPVPGMPGVYTVYNPMTGQQSYMVDNSAQQQAASQVQVQNNELSHSPPPTTPTFRAQVSPPPENVIPSRTHSISPPKVSPPKSSSSPPVDVNPLPPPSANAFRRGHARGLSSVTGAAMNAGDGPKSSVPKSAGFPATPMTGTFGPGQNRAGDHPVRQPRGPPSLEELVDKPTSKHEGSKNFVTRQRRRAVNNLVRAGLDRRAASRGSNSIDSIGTPSSECEITFSISSESDSDSVGSRSDSQSGRPSPIGSERKEMKERSRDRTSAGTPFTTASLSSEEGMMGGKMVEVKMEETEDMNERRKAPLLVLTSAEKRKSAVF